MPPSLEFSEPTSAICTIRELIIAKAEAVAQLSTCRMKLESEEEMLASLLVESKTSANQQYLKAAKKACQMGVKAWKLSITAYQRDIDTYNAEIDAIQRDFPEARHDN